LQQQKIDRLKNELKQRGDQFMLLLKLQTPSNASRGDEFMFKEQLTPADAAKR